MGKSGMSPINLWKMDENGSFIDDFYDSHDDLYLLNIKNGNFDSQVK